MLTLSTTPSYNMVGFREMIGKFFTSGFLTVLFALLGSGGLALPQKEKPIQKEKAGVRLKTNLVLIPVWVTEKKTGLPIRGLEKEDFVLFENGVPQPITFFGQEDRPLSLLLLVEARFVEEIVQATRVLLGRLSLEDEVALMIFHGSPCLVQAFTTEKAVVIKKLRDLVSELWNQESGVPERCWGVYKRIDDRHSLLWTSIGEGTDYLLRASEQGRRRVMVVFTYNLGEGHMRNAERRALKKKVLERLYQSDIVVSGITLTPFCLPFTWAAIWFHPLRMDVLARVTGGRMVTVTPTKALHIRKLTQLVDQLRVPYICGYEPANTAHHGQLRQIEIRLSPLAKKKYKNTELRYRRTYIIDKGRSNGESPSDGSR